MKKIALLIITAGFLFAASAQTKTEECCSPSGKDVKVTKTTDGKTTTTVTKITVKEDASALPKTEKTKEVKEVKKVIVKDEKEAGCQSEGSSGCCPSDKEKKSEKEQK